MKNKSKVSAILFTILGSILIIGFFGVLVSIEPEWKTNQRRINKKIEQSYLGERQHTATIILSRSRAENIYIPSEITITDGGDGIILTGPTKIIAKLHREAWDLGKNQ